MYQSSYREGRRLTDGGAPYRGESEIERGSHVFRLLGDGLQTGVVARLYTRSSRLAGDSDRAYVRWENGSIYTMPLGDLRACREADLEDVTLDTLTRCTECDTRLSLAEYDRGCLCDCCDQTLRDQMAGQHAHNHAPADNRPVRPLGEMPF